MKKIQLIFKINKLPISPFAHLFVICAALAACSCHSLKKPAVKSNNDEYSLTVAFWNVENFFDTIKGEKSDEDFTPTGQYAWNTTRYLSKINRLNSVIEKLNPDVLGLCEVENRAVLEELVESLALKGMNYNIIHYESEDERGIDVALLYKVQKLSEQHSNPINVQMPGNDKTRSILHAQLLTRQNGDTLHFFVNHWPSRRGGTVQSNAKRAIAAKTLRDYLLSGTIMNENALIMGDLNDNAWDSSIREVLGACKISDAKQESCKLLGLGNLYSLDSTGTLRSYQGWDFFDQFIITQRLWNSNKGLKFKPFSLTIFAPDWMKQQDGKYDGYPLRTFGGKNYLDGYSDHFPVYLKLIYAGRY